jgi:hypothetical protein
VGHNLQCIIHPKATDFRKIYQHNYGATKMALKRTLKQYPTLEKIIYEKDRSNHPIMGFKSPARLWRPPYLQIALDSPSLDGAKMAIEQPPGRYRHPSPWHRPRNGQKQRTGTHKNHSTSVPKQEIPNRSRRRNRPRNSQRSIRTRRRHTYLRQIRNTIQRHGTVSARLLELTSSMCEDVDLYRVHTE